MFQIPVPRKRWLAALAVVLIAPGVARTQDAPAATPNSLRDACVKALGSVETLEPTLAATRKIPADGLAAARTDARAARDQWAAMTWQGDVRLVKRTMRTRINRAIDLLDRCAASPTPTFKYLTRYVNAADVALEEAVAAIAPYTVAEEPPPVVDVPLPPPPTPVTPPSSVPILRPGTGFSGSTSQPAKVGSGWASSAKAIARWDVVPFQTFDTELQIGVVAFHANGINRVEFSANGGTWTSSTAPTLNPATGVWEYCVLLRAQDYSDGQFEVRAVVYPNAGVPRVLAGNFTSTMGNEDRSMFLSANYGHSLSEPTAWVDSINGSDTTGDGTQSKPFKTVANALDTMQSRNNVTGGCDGLTLNLKRGSYSVGNSASPSTDKRWVTVQAAPGVARSDVVFSTYSDGVDTKLFHLKNVTMRRPGTVFGSTSASFGPYIWWDNVLFDGTGRTLDWGYVYFEREYTTDCTYQDMRDGAAGCYLARGATILRIREDAFSNTPLVLRSVVDVIDGTGTDAHSDVYQFWGAGGARENVIIYDVRATNCLAQHIFAKDFSTLDNVAIVNFLAAEEYNTDGGVASQWGQLITSCDHILLHNSTLPSQSFMFIEDASFTNCSIRGNVFNIFSDSSAVDWSASKIQDNHFINTTQYGAVTRGTGVSTGNAGFTSPSTDNFAPSSTSVLKNRMTPLAPDDATGAARGTTDSVGALK